MDDLFKGDIGSIVRDLLDGNTITCETMLPSFAPVLVRVKMLPTYGAVLGTFANWKDGDWGVE